MSSTASIIDTTEIPAGTWTIDANHSEVGFTVRHLMSKVRGQFEKFEGTITTGPAIGDTRASAEIDMGSVNTRQEQRDAHLRSPDIFDAEKHRQMKFRTLSFDGQRAVGELTIKGVTNTVELDVDFLGEAQDAAGGTVIAFEATGVINRRDFGVDFNVPLDGGKLLVGDKVSLNIVVEAVLQES